METWNFPYRQNHDTTGLPGGQELVEWLQDQPIGDALGFLRELACLVGWQPALNEAGLRLLKPGVPLAEAVAA